MHHKSLWEFLEEIEQNRALKPAPPLSEIHRGSEPTGYQLLSIFSVDTLVALFILWSVL